MQAMRRGGPCAAMRTAAAACVIGLAGCGGAPSAPATLPAAGPDFTFMGTGTTVVYVDPQGHESGHNRNGREGISGTAPGATISRGFAPDLNGDGRGAPEEINQALDQAARGNHIVANGWGPGSDGVRGIPTFKDPVAFANTMEGNPDTAYVTAAAPVGQVSLAVGTSRASNGIVAAAVKDDSGAEGDDGYTCALTGTSSCIGVNMNRGSWRGPATDRTPATASWATAKLAGYAALLREAFAPANGEQLVGIILDGVNEHNVFQLDRALERAGLPAIGNGMRYANARESDTGGGATADASQPHVVEDYGTVVAGAWRAETTWTGDSLKASLSEHQPPRTERARVRLRHGEGMMRERRGRGSGSPPS